MTDVVITAAKRTPVGAFLGAFATTPAHALGRVAIEAALAQSGVPAGDVSEVILGQVLTAAQGQNPARQASMGAGIPGDPRLGRQPGLRIGAARGRARRAGDPDRRFGDRRRRRPGEYEPVDPRPASARRHQDGRARAGRHDDQGRPDRRVQQLSYGNHGRESGRAVPGHPRRPGRVRDRLAEQGVEGARRGPVQGRDRPRHRQDPQGRDRVDADEYIRDGVERASLGGLNPAFKKDGSVTAGNASGLNDGAAAWC